MIGASLLQCGHQVAKKTNMVGPVPPSPTETLPPSTVSAVKLGAVDPTGIKPSSFRVKSPASSAPTALNTAKAAIPSTASAVTPVSINTTVLLPPEGVGASPLEPLPILECVLLRANR